MSNPSSDSGLGDNEPEQPRSPMLPSDSAWATSRPAWPGEDGLDKAPDTGARWRRYPIALSGSALISLLIFMLPAFLHDHGRVGEVLAANGLGLLPIFAAVMLLTSVPAIFYRARWATTLAGTVGILVSLALFGSLALVSLAAVSLGTGFFAFWGIGWWLLWVASVASFVLSIFVLVGKE